jgi:D-alanine-D-alanine ligase
MRRRTLKKRRVLVLMHESLVPPDSLEGYSEEQIVEWKVEFDVTHTLREMGHDVRPLGVSDELGPVRRAIEEWKPHVTFNLLEEFHGVGLYDTNVVAYLELMRQPYTGCNPRGLLLAHDKALSKKILAYHRIPTPRFWVFPLGRKVHPPKRAPYPLLVKSVSEEASLGISKDSLVRNEEQLVRRAEYIHEKIHTDALVEEFIEGRELYVGVLGNQRLATLPIWEMLFTNVDDDTPVIATARAKWNSRYQKKIGLVTQAARHLPEGLRESIPKLCKRVYRALNLSGCARIDLRLREDGRAYVLEANPNPNLAYGEDFAESAEKFGLRYEELLQRIIGLGLQYKAAWRG